MLNVLNIACFNSLSTGSTRNGFQYLEPLILSNKDEEQYIRFDFGQKVTITGLTMTKNCSNNLSPSGFKIRYGFASQNKTILLNKDSSADKVRQFWISS